eukprot:8515127-Alexandrium_andersonii.AAC.1
MEPDLTGLCEAVRVERLEARRAPAVVGPFPPSCPPSFLQAHRRYVLQWARSVHGQRAYWMLGRRIQVRPRRAA